jgi:RNA polymerase sigma-70 factor (ECF subfamily)
VDNGSESYKRFLDGDDTGMEDIITEYRDGLIFYLHKLVGSIEKAEELAEDTFVLLCIKKPKDKQKCSFKTWLYTIGRNLAIDYLRRSAKQITMPLDTYDTLCSDQDSPEEEYIRNSKKTIVNKALNKLKPEYRQVLWLLYFEDLQYKEISIIMNKSVHATQMLASRAKQALKNELIKEGFTNETY